MKRLLLLISTLLVSSPPAIAWEPGDDWRDNQCRLVVDGANSCKRVCRGIYGEGEIFLGIYWRDGAETDNCQNTMQIFMQDSASRK